MNLDQRLSEERETMSIREIMDSTAESTDAPDEGGETEAGEVADLDGETDTAEDTPEGLSGEGKDQGKTEETGKGVAVDRLLRDVRETLGPQYEHTIKQLQADHTRWNQNKTLIDQARAVVDENRKLQGELRGALDELNKNLDTEEVSEEDEAMEQLLATVTPDHEKLFRALLEKVGPAWATANNYVKKGDIEQREAQRQAAEARRTQVVSAIDQGIQQFGEVFGKKEANGAFILSDEAKSRMEPVYNRLGGPNFQGTILDLFLIACPDLVARAGPRSGRTQNERAMRAVVESRSTPSTVSDKIYKKGDSIRSVARRAAMLAMRELPNL